MIALRKAGSRRGIGFTLIELLVVVAIIAILAAILFPIFSKAKDKAKLTKCMGNLKQIGTAIHMYLDDNNGCFPIGPITDGNGQLIKPWFEGQCIGGQQGYGPAQGQPVATGYSPARYRPLFRYVRTQSVFRCPGELKQLVDRQHNTWDFDWHWFGSSYELNGAFAYPGMSQLFYQLFGVGWGVDKTTGYQRPRKLSEINNSKRMLMAAERQIHAYWGVPAGTTTMSVSSLGHMEDKPWTPAVYVDGHVSYVLMESGLSGKNWAIAQKGWCPYAPDEGD